MKLKYFEQTDTLYIDLSELKSVETSEVAPGISLDFDVYGAVVGIEIENASNILNSETFTIDIPFHKLINHSPKVEYA